MKLPPKYTNGTVSVDKDLVVKESNKILINPWLKNQVPPPKEYKGDGFYDPDAFIFDREPLSPSPKGKNSTLRLLERISGVVIGFLWNLALVLGLLTAGLALVGAMFVFAVLVIGWPVYTGIGLCVLIAIGMSYYDNRK